MSGPLHVFLDGAAVGVLTESTHGALAFEYEAAYLHGDDPTPLSLSLPIGRHRHTNKPVRSYLEGLLPDNRPVRERWARQYGVSAGNPFALLRHVGRDAAGAVQILPEETASDDCADRSGDVEILADDDVAALLTQLAEHRSDWDAGRRTGRWSLAGAQAKVALYRDPVTGRWGVPRDSTPTTHIVKPAIEGLADHHINEVVCLTAAAALGLPAARVEVLEAKGVQAIVSTRYDRALDASGRLHRLHQEDLCQALAVHPDLKYQSDGGPGVGEIADLFATLDVRDRTINAASFFDALAFNVLVGGPDAHAKNYSLLLSGRRARLAPLYDVASLPAAGDAAQPVSAMKIGDHATMHSIRERDWARVGVRLGLGADWSLARLRELRQGLPFALETALAALPPSTSERARIMVERINGHAERLPSL